MRAYIITTGSIFGLITLAHIWRICVERHLAREPSYVLLTIVSAVLCFWALRLLWLAKGNSGSRFTE
jgi:hypothetical protein